MPTPVLIDTDMGIDDAVAIALGLCSPELRIVGLASVGGNVHLEQATVNIGRLLKALGPTTWPSSARGLDQDQPLMRAEHVFGTDGLGECGLDAPPDHRCCGHLELYRTLIDQHPGELVVIAIGPLTNLASVLKEAPGLLERVSRIIIMGGALWCPGNVSPFAEFNFYRDPVAAAAVLSAGLPVTLVPLDVTRQIAMDESHLANLSRSETRTGELIARMIRYPIERKVDGLGGKFLVHDAVAVGLLLWPQLFIQAKMALDVVTSGQQAGRSKPAVAKDKTRQIASVISVNTVDFLENLVERLSDEKFVV